MHNMCVFSQSAWIIQLEHYNATPHGPAGFIALIAALELSNNCWEGLDFSILKPFLFPSSITWMAVKELPRSCLDQKLAGNL